MLPLEYSGDVQSSIAVTDSVSHLEKLGSELSVFFHTPVFLMSSWKSTAFHGVVRTETTALCRPHRAESLLILSPNVPMEQ